MNHKGSFTEGKILSPLLTFAFPILVAMFLQSMYGAVDLLVVGRFGTAADVSAVATGSQIMQSITAIIIGLSMGVTILLGQKIGQKKQEELGAVMGNAIVFFVVIAIVITVTMLITVRPLVALMHAPQEAYEKSVIYVQICSSGAIFIVAYNVLGSIFRGMGDSKTPLLAVLIACITNIGGDLLFVAVFHMNTAGAALATVLSQTISVIICIVIIKKNGLPFVFTMKKFRINKGIIKRSFLLGFPIALQDLLVSISFLVILAIVNSLGLIPSAGVGVAEKLCGFIMLVPSAFMQSMSAFVAQNIGAGKNNRAKRAMAYGMVTSFAIGLIMGYLAFFHGDIFAGIFAKDPQVITAATQYLKAYAIDTLLVSFLFCYMGYFNGCGKTTFVMLQGIIGAFLVRIPVSYFMSHQKPVSLFHVGLATPSSTIVQIILCTIYFIIINRRYTFLGTSSDVLPAVVTSSTGGV